MAKVTGMFGLSGTINGRTFYIRNGIQYERKASNLTKERIAKEPAFAEQRKRMKDFGAASQLAGLLRQAWAEHLGHAVQRGLWNRLQQAVYSGVRKAPGDTGRRDASLALCTRDLNGLAYISKHRGNSGFHHAPLENLTRRRGTLRFELGISTLLTRFRSRVRSTHFEITITAVCCPAFLAQKNRRAHKWSFPPEEMESVDYTTGKLPLQNPGSFAQVVLRLPPPPKSAGTCDYVLFMTIRHFQLTGQEFYELDGSIHSQILAIL
jgi:hypothetical protein